MRDYSALAKLPEKHLTCTSFFPGSNLPKSSTNAATYNMISRQNYELHRTHDMDGPLFETHFDNEDLDVDTNEGKPDTNGNIRKLNPVEGMPHSTNPYEITTHIDKISLMNSKSDEESGDESESEEEGEEDGNGTNFNQSESSSRITQGTISEQKICLQGVSGENGNNSKEIPIVFHPGQELLNNNTAGGLVPFSNRYIDGASFTFLHDFTNYQLMVLKQVKNIDVDMGVISSIKLLDQMFVGNIAAKHYHGLVKWHEEIVLSSSNWNSSRSLVKNKKTLIKGLCRLLYGKYYSSELQELNPRPTHDILELREYNKSVKVSKFDLKFSLFSLLTDPELMKPENLLVYDDSYRYPDDVIGLREGTQEGGGRYMTDIHHGYSFVRAHRNMCTASNDILVEIIPFLDGTPIDAYGRLKLEALMFTLSIFNQSTRNSPRAWRLHGYLPDPCSEENIESIASVSDRGFVKNGDIVRKRSEYHLILKYLLNDFYSLENSEGILFNLLRKDGRGYETVRLKFVIPFFIGDAVGNDKLCDRYVSYGKNVKRLCRDCNCPTDKLSDYDYHCTLTRRSEIRELNNNEANKISYYKIGENALDQLSFGGDEFGSNGCLPPEFLHQFNQGTVKDLLAYFDLCLTKAGKELLDVVAIYLANNYHRQASKGFPNINIFKGGIEKPKLTGSEMIDKVFIIYLCLVQSYTFKELPVRERSSKHRYKEKKTKNSSSVAELGGPNVEDNVEGGEDGQNGLIDGMYNVEISRETTIVSKIIYPKIGQSRDSIIEWVKFLEYTLCMSAWLNQDKILLSDIKQPSGGDEGVASTLRVGDRQGDEDDRQDRMYIFESAGDRTVRNYLKKFVNLVRNPIGNGNNTAKIHWLLHIMHYVRKFGPPKVYSGQVPEHNLSPMVKKMARLTQMRPSVIMEQAMERYFEEQTIRRVANILQKQGKYSLNKRMEEKKDNYDDNMWERIGDISRSAVNRYCIEINEDTGRFEKVGWVKSKKGDGRGTGRTLFHTKQVMQQVIDRLRLDDIGLLSSKIDCFTTLHVIDHSVPGDDGKLLYRADPNFYYKHWLDWCVVEWGNTTDQDNHDSEYPCRLLMFIDTLNMSFSNRTNTHDWGRFLAVVRSTENDDRIGSQRKHVEHCRLLKSFKIELMLRIIPCESILRPAFVVSDLEDIKRNASGGTTTFKSGYCLQLVDVERWPGLFIDGFLDD